MSIEQQQARKENAIINSRDRKKTRSSGRRPHFILYPVIDFQITTVYILRDSIHYFQLEIYLAFILLKSEIAVAENTEQNFDELETRRIVR